MADTKANQRSASGKSSSGEGKISRIVSLDVMRGLMMFLMLFVNDIAGLGNIPRWLLHAAQDENRLGFSDIVFPGFLFAMGMAIPYAIETRRAKGDPLWSVALHVVMRTVALLVMGVFIVNYETIGGGMVPREWFAIGMVVCFFLIWGEFPLSNKYVLHTLKAIGIGVLIWFAYQYKGHGGAKFEPQWWGILGLIGWCYLTGAVVVLFTRFNLLLTLMVTAATIALCVLPDRGIISHLHLHRLDYLFPAGGVLNAFALVGVMLGVVVYHYGSKANFCKTLLPILCLLMLASLGAAYWARHYWIISKEQATPTWLFLCCGIFFALFIILYWMNDVAGKGRLFSFLYPAGAATLTCYMIPYLWYSVQALTHWWYPKVLNSGGLGLLRSLLFTFAIMAIVWCLIKLKVRLKI